MTQFYSYLWLREDGTPYYAGKGKGKRAFRNQGRIVRRPVDDSRILVFPHATEAEAFESEKNFIKWFGRKDLGTGCLRNHTAGGEGVCDWSAESRKKVGDKTRGLPSPRKGKTLSVQTRQRMSAAQKGNKNSLGHKNALGYHHNAATKAKISEANKNQNNRLGMHDTAEGCAHKRAAQQARRLREKQS